MPALTPREIDVLRLVAKGLTDDDIAVSLSIKATTVRSHLCHIRQKLGMPSRLHVRDHAWRVKLALYTLRQGWLPFSAIPAIGGKQQ